MDSLGLQLLLVNSHLVQILLFMTKSLKLTFQHHPLPAHTLSEIYRIGDDYGQEQIKCTILKIFKK